MKSRGTFFLLIFALFPVSIGTVPHSTLGATSKSGAVSKGAESDAASKAKKSTILGAYGRLPIQFEANHGQAGSQVKFLARTGRKTLLLTSTGASWRHHTTSGSAAALGMQLVGSNPGAQVLGQKELPGRSNYFIGNDPTKWRTNVPHYARVEYQDIYPGVNLVYHGSQSQLEYDFVVSPGADPGRIALRFDGMDRLDIDGDGNLVVGTAGGQLRQKKPYIYQAAGGKKQEVAGGYVLDGERQVRFELGAYDRGRPLVIDPIVYSTFLGGSSSDDGEGIAVDSSGSAYVTGGTTSVDFRVRNPAQRSLGNPPGTDETAQDAFVTKLNATGTDLVYSTYLGGDNSDQGDAIVVDAAGNAYIAGRTSSSNFPLRSPYQSSPGMDSEGAVIDNGFVAKLDPSGSTLLYSTYFHKVVAGTIYATQLFGLGVLNGNAYVAGNTEQVPGSHGNPDLQDCYVAELNTAGNGLMYSYIFGGKGDDEVESLFVDQLGNAYIAGETSSTDFPSTPGTYQKSYGGGDLDGFLLKLNPSGTAAVYATYLGGTGLETAEDVAVDTAGNAYVTGNTTGQNFPTTPGAYRTTPIGGTDMYVLKLNPAGTGLVYSTLLGGRNEEHADAMALDASGNVYIAGSTISTDFPTTPDAVQKTYAGGTVEGDGTISKLNATGTILLSSSYLGGRDEDYVDAIALDASGNVYVTGSTASKDFPVTSGVLQPGCGTDGLCNANIDAFVTKIGFPAGVATALSLASGNGQSGVVGTQLTSPLVVRVTDARAAGVAGVTVTFAVSPSSAGTLNPSTVITANDGTASTVVTLGNTAGPLTVIASAPGFPNVTFSLTATAMVTPTGPRISPGGVVSGGLSAPPVKTLAPNAIATVFGDGFAPAGTLRGVAGSDLVNGRLPTILNGVCVYVNNVASPLFFLGATQINFQVPQVSAGGNVSVQVATSCGTANEIRSATEPVGTSSAAPEFFYFTHSPDGKNPIAALNAGNGSYIGMPGLLPGATFIPASPGDILTLFFTGGGSTNPLFAAGELPATGGDVTGSLGVMLAGVPVSSADILYAGVSPGFAGLYQLNLRVPMGTPSGSQPVILTISGQASPAGYLFIGP